MFNPDVADLLSRHFPFDLLAPEERADLAAAAEAVRFAAGELILRQEGQPSDGLYLIRQGRVRMSVRAAGGDEVLLDARGPGDTFGLTSLLRNTATLMNIQAVEALACERFPRPAVLRALQANAAFSGALLQATTQRYLERSVSQLQMAPAWPREAHWLAAPVRALLSGELTAGRPDEALALAAARLPAGRSGGLVVIGAAGEALGLLAESEVRRALTEIDNHAQPLARWMRPADPVLEAQAPLAEALAALQAGAQLPLLVVERGRPLGLLTGDDLWLPGSLLQPGLALVYRADSLDHLSAGLRRAREDLQLLFRQGLQPERLARLLAGLHDQVVQRLLQMAEADLGPAPARYAWLVLGGEARTGQAFFTGQDSLLVYAGPAEASTQAYFEQLTARVGADLEQLGLPAANLNAWEARWRQPLSAWQADFDHWLADGDDQSIARLAACADLRPVSGSAVLANHLRDQVFQLAGQQAHFLPAVARLALARTPPSLPPERAEPPTGALDVLQAGILPIVDLVRLLALRHDVRETSTLARLAGLLACGALAPAAGEELRAALEELWRLRLRRQFNQLARGQAFDNQLQLASLNRIERAALRESLRLVAQQQASLRQAGFGRSG